MRRHHARNDLVRPRHWPGPRVRRRFALTMFRYAYVQFADPESAEKALKLNETLFKGRMITVMRKRKNLPGKGRRTLYVPAYSPFMGGGRGRFPPRGRGFRYRYRPYY